MKLKQPKDLRINLLKEAFNVTADSSFSWANESELENSLQTAYQIVIAKRKNDFDHLAFLYDSDWVESNQNTGVQLTEQLTEILSEGEMYYWTVRIKDNYGNISEFSEPAPFLTPVKDLNAKGIWNNTDESDNGILPKTGNFVFFRSPKFNVDLEKAELAYVRTISRGNEEVMSQSFDFYLNNKIVGVGSARPYKYYHGSQKMAYFYNTFSVSEYLDEENNIISALVTGTQKEDRAFFLELVVFNKDGSQETYAATNEEWFSLDGTSSFGDFGAKIRTPYFEMPLENIDTHFYPQNWTSKTFDDSNWEKSMVTSEDPKRLPMEDNLPVQLTYASLADDEEEITEGILLPFPSENTLRRETLPTDHKVTKLGKQNILFDLGKEIIGGLKVSFESPVDQTVVVMLGEQLKEDGHVRHHMAAGPDYIETWNLVAGKNEFTTIQMKNFRYIELKGIQSDVNVEDIRGWAMEQPFDDNESYFQSDNELLNAEFEFSKYSIKATNQDLYVDSQARERKAYEGDLLVNANTSYVVSSQYSLARYTIDYLLDNPTWPEDYKLFNVEMAWMDYLYTGDNRLLRERYEILKDKLLRGSEKTDNLSPNWRVLNQDDNFVEEKGLVTNNGLVDWPPVERDGYIEGKYNTPFNAIYAGVYDVMAKIAQVVGDEEDQAFYEKRAQIVKDSLIEQMYDEKSGKFFDSMNEDGTINDHYSHHASAYALSYNVYNSDEMAKKLSQYVANDGHFIGSVYFIYFMIRGLINTDHGDQVYRLLTDSAADGNEKTFDAILNKLNATIAPEAWSNNFKPNLTLSHPWGAVPGLALIQGILGVMPLTPGFETFRVYIQPGELTKISAKTPTIRGDISIEYRKEKSKSSVLVNVPMNTQAELVLSTKDGLKVERLGSGKHFVEYDEMPKVCFFS